MFNLNIDDLSNLLDNTGKGIIINDKNVTHLFYADDLVIIADSPENLHYQLNILHNWCDSNKMTINTGKTKIMHFRNPSMTQSTFTFTCGDVQLGLVDKYRYLGLTLNNTLDYNITVKYVAQASTRALGLLISKFRSIGGLSYDVYTKLYDTLVWSIISNVVAIWETREYSSLNAVQHRDCCFFLGVGKYTPNAAVCGDMGWSPPFVRQWKTVMSHWYCLNDMNNNIISNTDFKWSARLRGSHKTDALMSTHV